MSEGREQRRDENIVQYGREGQVVQGPVAGPASERGNQGAVGGQGPLIPPTGGSGTAPPKGGRK